MSLADDAVLRRAFCLIGYWEHDGFTLENYVSGRQTLVAPLVAQWLASLSSDTSYDEVLVRLGPVPDAASLVQRLVDQDVLLVIGTLVERQDRLVQETWKWDHSARFLHYRTRRMTTRPIRRRSLQGWPNSPDESLHRHRSRTTGTLR